ncbi:RNA polymerase sigma factor [Vallitalea okinawensis]|uniref:RNA polymerase sigma factor n=1 Tax=Vallitalea okinawensis TaxID=2078660 RepID=UPI000CFB1CFE|nr:RNA polymerase sigma factor [Vallitalea okinawensis]
MKPDPKDKKLLLKNLYEKYSEDIYKVAYYISKDQYIAEEILQETFIKAYTKIDTLNNPDSVRPWLITIASNLTKKKLKSTKNKVYYYSNLTDFEYLISNKPINNIDHMIIKDHLKECINSLEPDFREVLILYFFNQLSYEEIAEKLNIRLGTVKSRLSRAKKKLKERYDTDTYA